MFPTVPNMDSSVSPSHTLLWPLLLGLPSCEGVRHPACRLSPNLNWQFQDQVHMMPLAVIQVSLIALMSLDTPNRTRCNVYVNGLDQYEEN